MSGRLLAILGIGLTLLFGLAQLTGIRLESIHDQIAAIRAQAERSSYVRAAVGRGIPWRRVVWGHALPVAIRPVLGVYGIILGSVFSGSFAVEIVTAWPGLGQLMYEALVSRDIYLVSGCAIAGSLFLALGNLVSDVALLVVDPRLRTSL